MVNTVAASAVTDISPFFSHPPHLFFFSSQFGKVVKRTLQGYSHAGESFERLI